MAHKKEFWISIATSFQRNTLFVSNPDWLLMHTKPKISNFSKITQQKNFSPFINPQQPAPSLASVSSGVDFPRVICNPRILRHVFHYFLCNLIGLCLSPASPLNRPKAATARLWWCRGEIFFTFWVLFSFCIFLRLGCNSG